MREKTCWRWVLARAMNRNDRSCVDMLLQWVIAVLLVALPGVARADDAEVIMVVGRAEMRESDVDDWKPLRVQQKLPAGASVRTGQASQVALLLKGQTQLRVNQQSTLRLTTIESQQETSLELLRGRIWGQVKAVLRLVTAVVAPTRRIRVATPAATIGIRGTDWDLEVGEGDKTTVTVLSGEAEVFNEQGRVAVLANEQATAVPGKAPTKILLTNAAERVQWVTSYRPQPRRWVKDYSGGIEAIIRNIEAEDFPAALNALATAAKAPQRDVRVSLLLADLNLFQGEAASAIALLSPHADEGRGDPMASALLARAFLVAGRIADAGRILANAVQTHAAHFEVLLSQAEYSRIQGDVESTRSAARKVLETDPKNAEGWYVIGRIETEREYAAAAREALKQAIALRPDGPGYQGELATLETFANEFPAAQKAFNEALAQQPGDYVALTGLSVLQLKRGETEQALDTLLRANVIEPKYARAVIYTAIAYYQLGRHRAALETLARASELDPRDPLPHQLASMIHTDLVEPGQGLDAARRAMRLMPYLKSLNQLANDQKGTANLGNALAQFGLDDWAMNYAQQSYTPFWAGSHLFLADRYQGGFNKQSELMQGFITDPTLFGASNRFQTLLPKPGHYFSAGAAATRSDDLRTTMPSFVANGFSNSVFPVAYFVEGLRVNLRPGDLAFDGKGSIVTTALGLAPRADLSIFAFVTAFDADVNSPTAPFKTDRTSGWENRLDLGLNYKFLPTSQSWLKVGFGEESAVNTTTEQQPGRDTDTRFDFRPRNRDLQYRHSLRLGDHEWTWGLENARAKKRAVLTSNSRINFGGTVLTTQIREDSPEEDKSWMAYLSDRVRLNDQWLLDLGVHYQKYEKTASSITQAEQGGFVFTDAQTQLHSRSGSYPRLGLAYQRRADELWRFAYQKWLRPNAANTLSPVATAGIPLDDQVVLPGGELQRLRFQFEKELSASTFVSLFLDRKRIHNLGEPGSVLNQREEVANLDRLRNRSVLILRGSGEILEQPSVFLEGRIDSAGVSINQRLSDTLSGYANYVHTDSRNTHRDLANFDLPYMPRHRVTLGANWVGAERLLLQAQAVYRSRRFIDEFHSDELPAGWDATLKATWQSAGKRWLVEGFATNLLKDRAATVVGVNAVWRY